jgi:HlyD family secretion protein
MMKRKLGKRIKVIFISALLISALGAASYFIWVSSSFIDVEAGNPQIADIENRVEETGYVACKRSVTVFSNVSGIVKDVAVELGDRVRNGQLLLEMDASDMRYKLAEANERIAGARASYELVAESKYDKLSKGLDLQIKEAERQKETRKTDYKRIKELYESDIASLSEYEAAQNEYDASVYAVESLKLQKSQLDKEASSNSRAAARAEMNQAIASRDSILLEMSRLKVKSQLSGTVIEMDAEDKAVVQAGTVMMKIGDMDNLVVEVDVLADDIEGLNLGDKVRMTAGYLGGKTLSGKVSKLSTTAKETMSSLGISQKRIKATVKLKSQLKALKPGLPLDSVIVKNVHKSALCISTGSIMEDGSGTYVYVVEGGIVKRRAVNTGIESGAMTEVVSGLSESDNVLLSIPEKVKEGTKVHVALK